MQKPNAIELAEMIEALASDRGYIEGHPSKAIQSLPEIAATLRKHQEFVEFCRRWAWDKDGNGTSADEKLDCIKHHPVLAECQRRHHAVPRQALPEAPREQGAGDLYECNHHHLINDEQVVVDFGTGRFVADKVMVPLLRALNDAGLTTRTHCCGHHPDNTAFVGIILDEYTRIEFRHVAEPDADRDTFRGEKEILISWKLPDGFLHADDGEGR